MYKILKKAGESMARFTQKLMTDALRSLMNEKSPDSVTVADIVNRADINRKTFYYHFHGLSDLINYTFIEDIKNEIPDIPPSPENWQMLFAALLEYVQKNRKYLSAVYDSSYGPSFRMQLRRMFETYVTVFVRAAAAEYEEKHNVTLLLTGVQKNYIIKYYSMAFFGMVEQWAENDSDTGKDEFIYMLSKLSSDNMYETFAEISKDPYIKKQEN
jgi:AcrR family transcriptional regulator